MDQFAMILSSIIGLIVILISYFIPTIIALIRKHRDVMAIFVLNLFLGWSLIGWIISLVWAFKK